MYGFLRSWRWAGLTLLAVVLCVVFVLLGFWQLGQFHDSEEHDGPIDLGAISLAGEPFPSNGTDRIVRVEGRYDARGQALIAGINGAGKPGFLVVTPVADLQGDVIRVVRGWVAQRTSPAVEVPTGGVRVVGTLQRTTKGLPAIPGVPDYSLHEGWIVLTGQTPAVSPAPQHLPTKGIGTTTGGNGVNLGYALQWWVFAIAVLFMLVRMAQLEARDRLAAAEREAALLAAADVPEQGTGPEDAPTDGSLDAPAPGTARPGPVNSSS